MFKITEIVLPSVFCCFACGIILQTATTRKHQRYAMNYREENQDYEATDKSYDSSRALYDAEGASGNIQRNYKWTHINQIIKRS